MKKFFLLFTLAFSAVTLVASPAGAGPSKPAPDGVSGGFSLTVHTHSSGKLLFPQANRLSYDFLKGESFAYSSRPCGGRAPFNDLGLDFKPDYPGVDDDADGTAPSRHRVQGTVTEVNGDRGTIVGTITTVLCVPTATGGQTESANSIVTNFEAKFRRTTDNVLQIIGKFEISPTQSTGTFAGLEGQGSIKAIFTCLGNQRDPNLPTCQDLGEFTDFVAVRGDVTKGPGELKPGLVGTYRDATVVPV